MNWAQIVVRHWQCANAFEIARKLNLRTVLLPKLLYAITTENVFLDQFTREPIFLDFLIRTH